MPGMIVGDDVGFFELSAFGSLGGVDCSGGHGPGAGHFFTAGTNDWPENWFFARLG